MHIDPNFIPPEHRTAVEPGSTETYEYTWEDRVRDGVAALFLCAVFGLLVWVAFALDVMTTGM